MVISGEEKSILSSIIVSSDNDPNKPEFPYKNPKFPATPTYKIKVPGFSDVWLKDESYNPTGTHKDRMAWEIVVTYRDFLLAKKRGQINGALPHMSIISSGSAAIAIQTILKEFNLPNLKVLMDIKAEPFIVESTRKIGCDIYQTDLSKKPLNSQEILSMTNNSDGFDITSGEALDPGTRFYDRLSYEILNSSPDYCFVPFGTGNLYENILNVAKQIVTSNVVDPRFTGEAPKICRCNFFGATTNNPKSKAVKLYSSHLPFVHFSDQRIRTYKYSGYCGSESNVYLLQEYHLDEAIKLAKKENINCEASGIAGLGLLLQMKDKIPKNKKILIVNTGKTIYP